MAAPVKKGEKLELRIDSLAYGGNGVGRVNGFVVFVRGGLPGDLVRARVTKTKRGFAEAVAESVLEPSSERVQAPCRHFGICGGCRFQDLAYEAQLASKEQQVRDALVRIGRIAEPPLEPIVPAASVYGYRNKLEYSFASGEGGVELGFHRAGRWDEVVGIEECLLTTDLGNAIRLAVRDWAREERLEGFDQATGTGYLRHLVVREGRNTGQVLVLLVTAPGDRFESGYFVDVLRRFPEVRSVHWAINDTPAERTNLPTKLLWGEDAIEEQILGLRFRRSTGTRSCRRTRRWPSASTRSRASTRGYGGTENVLDLYCGTGTIALALAGDARSVWGLEISEESVACAIENAELNGIANARFFAGNVGQTLEELVEESGAPDVVVVDPPRAGLAGKALRRTGAAGRGADRLRLLQPDDARLGPQGAARRVRVRAPPLPAGGHVPAHAARRVGVAPGQGARSLGRLSPRAPGRPHIPPEQVGVREEEPEARPRAAPAAPARRPSSDEDERQADRNAVIAEPGPADAEPEAVRRPRGRARRRGCRAARCSPPPLSPGLAERDRDALEEAGLLLDDVASSGRTRPTRCRPRGRPPRRATTHQSSSKRDRNQKPSSA